MLPRMSEPQNRLVIIGLFRHKVRGLSSSGRAPSFIGGRQAPLLILGTGVQVPSGLRMYFIARTGPFRAFQRRVGNATFHINSAYIGLEWIARGKGKPDGLDINWTAPEYPRQAVDQARSLLHSAMLSRVFDELDSYLRALADEPWLVLTPDQRDILRRAFAKPGGGAYTLTERFLELRLDLDANAAVDLAMVATLVTWRNQTIHVRPADLSGRLRLDRLVEEQLTKEKVMLGKRYGGLDPRNYVTCANRGLPNARKS
jgi:hypothetical protein